MVNNLRNNERIKWVIVGFILAIHSYSVLQMFFNDNFFEFFERLRFFTNLSNILAFLAVLFYVLKLDSKPFYKYFSVITLVSILITGIIYHALLSDGNLSLNNHFVHTFSPIAFPIFYFLFVTPGIKIRDFWVTLIFPLCYFVIILIQGAFTNWYPYGFLNPTLPDASLTSVLVFCCLILLPVIAVFTVFLVFLKNLLEKQVIKKA
ncbi:Pr6Pr family membrane protein [Acholeplasma hippikon]|uniref:Integral membrane protein (Intg_mem_TP0381) n=1 Tax=Acholeplasma hippikon TaxID=264636 RepID=A0A449BJP5_9MOLU|nr:Pr6Pr family membrane protein [Acholeplasma hippikon]VEU82547.1 Uncharacterised protein [Acholeplasma hippikon]